LYPTAEIPACLIVLRVGPSFPLKMFRRLAEFHETSHGIQDTEDQSTYFLNFPDIINNNLVVQRTSDFDMILATLDGLLKFY
jgi:hypothetical protein